MLPLLALKNPSSSLRKTLRTKYFSGAEYITKVQMLRYGILQVVTLHLGALYLWQNKKQHKLLSLNERKGKEEVIHLRINEKLNSLLCKEEN